MPKRQALLRLFSVALGVTLCAGAFPAAARQMAKAQKQATATGTQPQAGSVPLRVGLVITDATRSYKTMVMLTRVEFGRRLADKATTIFNQTFATVQPMSNLPSDPRTYGGLDLTVVVDLVSARAQTQLFAPTIFSLSARFTVLNSSGQQILQMQETSTEKSNSPAGGPDAVGEMAVRKFIQDLVLSPAVRAMLLPAPASQAPAQPVLADTAAMDSSGLEVPPPPPWVPLTPASGAPGPGGKP
jgi:hypothetical protein